MTPAGALPPMLPAAPLLCLARLLICAGGLAPTVTFADTGSAAGVHQPARPVRLALPADVPPDPARLRPGLGVRAANLWLERPLPRRAGPRDGWGGQLYLPTGQGLTEVFGYIRFATSGVYTLRIAADAPVRLAISSLALYDSGEAAPEGGLTPPLPLAITAAGWYPLKLMLASGDGTVRLDWLAPAALDNWQAVPQAMLGH